MAELKIGTKVKDRYTLKEFKGQGSFGEVWLAHDEILDSDVAIKIYISLDPRGVEEFKREYFTTQGISNPYLLTSNYFDVWEQHPILVMKYCAKGSSAALAGKIDEYALWYFIHDVAAGLNYLHSLPEPIMHQDIKPDNVLVDDSDRFLITDFGISKKIRSTTCKQSKHAIGAGATAYMGPERFEADPIPIKASDIWSLGASIYELATGELPFDGLGGGMQRNGAEMPSLDDKWSKDLNMVMQACLAKETWDRPTAAQLEEYSESILNGKPAKVTWNMPEETSGNIIPVDESSNPGFELWEEEPDEDVSNSNKKRIWIAVGIIIAAIILLFLIWPTNKQQDEQIIEEQTVEEVDSMEAEPQETIEVPEVQPQKAQSDAVEKIPAEKPVATPIQSQTKTETPKATVEDNAAILKKALSSGDYQQVQKLANKGYAAAYGPLAKYYLKNHDYNTAETYAQKAKAAGFSEGSSVIKTLENLGYYD